MQTTNLLPDILTVKQVASYLAVSRNTVYNWTNSGELPSFKAGNTRRIRKKVLVDWIREKEGG
ncbi:MAG: helix-turn-helix domain-containing protein [Bacteroidales bacterium]|jgi:excisionase family DNA binding protein|nr:helix-turn-helix domain-containing protein [Bacteroidales bacterium]